MSFMKRMTGAAVLGAALLTGSGLLASPAQAGYVVTLEQVGSDVVATGSGPIDLTGLLPVYLGGGGGFILPALGRIVTGSASPASATIYSGNIIGPTSFGSGGLTYADTSSGDLVAIAGDLGELAVPAGYRSGDSLSDSSTYLNQSFASLKVIPGTYEWVWGTGANQNFTLDIGTTAVPEPASLALLGTALAGMLLTGAIRRRRSKG